MPLHRSVRFRHSMAFNETTRPKSLPTLAACSGPIDFLVLSTNSLPSNECPVRSSILNSGHPHALNRLPGVTAAGSQRNTNGLTASRARIEPWRLTDLLTRLFPTPDTVKPRSQGFLIHPHLTMNWAGRPCRRTDVVRNPN